MHDYLGTYCFLDHGVIDREGICTGLNAIYCRALFCASWLAAQAELPDQAQIYKHRVAKVSQEIHELTWVPDDGLYADGFHDGAVSPYKSWQSNVLAIYGGIAQPEQYETIWQHFFSADEPYELFSAGEANNPYFKHFLLEAAFALGKNAWAMRLIKHYWGKMVEAGATTWWELFDPDNPASKLRMCSKCHGYGVSPNVFLISELVGIRPAAPGMRMVFFNPMPLAVPWVKAGIPTPHGHINVEWQMRADGVFEAAISATYPLEVIPILNPKIAETAILSVSEKVAILAQDES
jgi:cytochrome c553